MQVLSLKEQLEDAMRLFNANKEGKLRADMQVTSCLSSAYSCVQKLGIFVDAISIPSALNGQSSSPMSTFLAIVTFAKFVGGQSLLLLESSPFKNWSSASSSLSNQPKVRSLKTLVSDHFARQVACLFAAWRDIGIPGV